MIEWIAMSASLIGSFFLCLSKPKLKTVFVCYFIANIINIIYFSVTKQIPYILVNIGFMITTIKGLREAYKK